MMHYKKGKNVEEELTKEQIPIEALPKQFLWMQVKGGSRIFTLVDYAKKSLEAGEYRSVVWSGSDGGVGKTISCAEIMKKDFELHQVTRVCYRKVEEYWDPQQEGLEQIVATRNIPSIHILMSLDELDPKTPGYQHSKTRTNFWMESDPAAGDKKGQRKGGNYFTGPQLKKKPNKNYEKGVGDEKGGATDGAADGGRRGKGKNKNKNKGEKPSGGDSATKQKGEGGAGGESSGNKPKKAKNDENKRKAEGVEAGKTEKSAPTKNQPMES